MDRSASAAKMEAVDSQRNIDTNLIQRLSVDAAAAMVAAISVSPIMAIIDRGVTEAATGQITTLESMKFAAKEMLRRPHIFIASKPFRTMLLLYSGTYLIANSIDTLTVSASMAADTEQHSNDVPTSLASATTSSTTKLCAVTAVNVGLALYKDATFARTFGSTLSPSSSPARRALPSLPPICYVPLILRDTITLFATFNAPALLAPALPDRLDTSPVSRLALAQVAAPAASQFVGTPLHLLGLDLYYRQGSVGWRARWAVITRLWGSASVARACRVVPAYGLGGVINTDARTGMMGWWVGD